MKLIMNKIPAVFSARTPKRRNIGILAIRAAKKAIKIPFLIPLPAIKAAIKPPIVHKIAEGE